MRTNTINLLILAMAILAVSLGCGNAGENSNANRPAANTGPPPVATKPSAVKPAKLDGYTIKGIKFAYFKVAPGLKRDELIETAQKLHEQEPDTQLVLVDDDSELADYIHYAKALSGQGELDKPLPVDWADKHIIANVQKYMEGKFVLCEGYRSTEIAQLK